MPKTSIIKGHLRQVELGELDSRYLSQYMNSELGRSEVNRLMAGGGKGNLNAGELKKYLVSLPSLEEQREIAEILETWDEAIALTERAIEVMKKRRKAFAEKLLKGQSNAEWRLEKLENIAKTYSGGTPSRSNPKYFEGNIPWIKSGEVNREIIKDTEESISQEALLESSAKLISAGTILVAMYGATAGKIAISEIDAAINQAILAIVPSGVDRDFLYYSLKNEMDQVVRKVQGGQPNLNAQIIKETKVFLPSPERQKLIGQFLKIVDIELRHFEQLKDLYQEQKRGLMQKLLTGEWRVAIQEAA
jgi:type I restriction enzyme S subunit